MVFQILPIVSAKLLHILLTLVIVCLLDVVRVAMCSLKN